MNDTDENDTPPTSQPNPHTHILNYQAIGSIPRHVIRAKLNGLRHLVIPRAVQRTYLEHHLFPRIVSLFEPQRLKYNQTNVDWNISCYLEVMPGGLPCPNPNVKLFLECQPLLNACNDIFYEWYVQQHPAVKNKSKRRRLGVERLMTFVTRYTAAPGEQALLKHIDGAGKVDGSVVLALPSDPDSPFEGHGGGLTFWDGSGKQVLDYDTRCGDLAFIDRAVWHQANPITKGVRWALVIFYKVNVFSE